jgi:hypothetical protein
MFFYCFSLYKGNSERTESVNILSGRKKKSYLSLYKSVYYRTNDFASVNHVFVVEFIHVYKLDQKKFSFEKDLYICACYIPPVSSVYYDDNFSKLEDENSKVMSNCTCNILIAGDLNARILNHIDFIVNESIKNVIRMKL